MYRRKVGEVVMTNDDGDILMSKSIWGNAWNYDDKIWFTVFWNSDNYIIMNSDKILFESLGFKCKEVFTKWSSYYKFSIVSPRETLQQYLDNLDNKIVEINSHTANGIATYKVEFKITKNAEYIYDEKLIDAI